MSATTQQVSNAEQVRDRVHRMWGTVAASWGEHADEVEERAAVVTRTMIDAVGPVAGDEVLELACGAGGLGLVIAEMVSPGGRVVLSDVAPEMVAIAADRATRHGARHAATAAVSSRVLDLEHLDLPDACFDIAVCREGLMFALDPTRAATEIARVLRPGGRLALAVWGPRTRNPWLGVLLDTVQEHTGSPVPPAGIPGPFSLAGDGALAGILTQAGFEEIQVQELAVPTHDASFDAYWRLRTELAGPFKGLLAALPDDQRTLIRETVHTRLSKYQTPAGLTIPGVSYLASARRPDRGETAFAD
jgi:SAM-dependent methyltransferase